MGAKAGSLAAGTLGLAGEGRQVLRVLRHGLGQRGGVGLGGTRGHGGMAAGHIALRAKLPAGGHGHGEGSCQSDEQRMPPEQPQDYAAHHG